MEDQQVKKAKAGSTIVLSPDQPVSITIIKSGWSGMYHVIIELGDSETFETFFYGANEIEKKFKGMLPHNWKEMVK